LSVALRPCQRHSERKLVVTLNFVRLAHGVITKRSVGLS
jgi:hypothetical protein